MPMSEQAANLDLPQLERDAAHLSLSERLELIADSVSGRIVITTSFGLEDQVITHAIAAAGLGTIGLATLDTGRLFPETHDVWRETVERYRLPVAAFFPDTVELERLLATDGPDAFYGSRDARTHCCHVRKVVPLARALQGAAGWITGLRGDQSNARSAVSFASVDAARGLLKFNPLFDWTRMAVADFAAAANVPLNRLHAKGFVSIGCAPCTRAIAPGEPERAGRWWWEDDAARECGLHVDPSGRLVRMPATPVRHEEVFL